MDKIYKSIEKNKTRIFEDVKNNMDIKCRDFLIGEKTKACVFMLDGMTNKNEINRDIIMPVLDKNGTDFPHTIDYIFNNIINFSEAQISQSFDGVLNSILNGDAVLFIDKENSAITFAAKEWATRSISEPPSSGSIRGPREGFTEDIKQNMTMIRRKIRNENLIYKSLVLGEITKTNVVMAYIDGICEPELVEKIYNKISSIKINGIVDSSYIAKFLDRKIYSIFKQVGTTERPDTVVGKLLEGRIAIIVDNAPMVLTVPFLLFEDFQSLDDYYSRPAFATFSRIVRIFAMMIAVYAPAIFVAMKQYHLQLFPLRFLLTLNQTIKGLPLAPTLEMFVALTIFEVLREASIRIPRIIGMAVSITGSLVLGQTAVEAGIISTPTLLILAISSIAIYTVPEQESAVVILRLVFLILAGSLGIMGILAGTIFVSSYLASITSYGTPYLAPFAPLLKNDLKDAVFKASLLDCDDLPDSIPNVKKKPRKKHNQ